MFYLEVVPIKMDNIRVHTLYLLLLLVFFARLNGLFFFRFITYFTESPLTLILSFHHVFLGFSKFWFSSGFQMAQFLDQSHVFGSVYVIVPFASSTVGSEWIEQLHKRCCQSQAEIKEETCAVNIKIISKPASDHLRYNIERLQNPA